MKIFWVPAYRRKRRTNWKQYLRAIHRLYADAQIVSSNYTIGADGWLEGFLKLIGLTGFDSTGLGLVAEYDTRDNIRNPTEGRQFQAHNIAYRESLGGDESFDVYQLKYNQYINFKENHVLAWQVQGRLTHDAPIGGYSSVMLRGYVGVIT